MKAMAKVLSEYLNRDHRRIQEGFVDNEGVINVPAYTPDPYQCFATYDKVLIQTPRVYKDRWTIEVYYQVYEFPDSTMTFELLSDGGTVREAIGHFACKGKYALMDEDQRSAVDKEIDKAISEVLKMLNIMSIDKAIVTVIDSDKPFNDYLDKACNTLAVAFDSAMAILKDSKSLSLE